MLFLFLKVLAQNSGYDPQETLVKVQAEYSESEQPVGIDLNTGKKVKKNYLLSNIKILPNKKKELIL